MFVKNFNIVLVEGYKYRIYRFIVKAKFKLNACLYALKTLGEGNCTGYM